MEKLKKIIGAEPFDNIVFRLLSALCISALMHWLFVAGDFTVMANYAEVGLIRVVAVFVIVFVILTFATLKSRNKRGTADRTVLLISFGFYSLLSVLTAKSYYYTFGLIVLYAVLFWYFGKKGYFKVKELTKKQVIIYSVAVGVIFGIILAVYLVGRYLSNYAPNYDFGIFCQMFEYLRSEFRPLTTVERDGLLSHFSVHMSLIYYIVLPIYMVFPSPVTIQLFQVFALASAAVPVYFLGRKYKLSNLKIVLIEAAVMFHPALFGGSGYDFHENCFLVPILLWLFYFWEKRKYIPLAIMAVLVCMVKEDAPVYVIFFAIWVFFSSQAEEENKKVKRITAIALAGGALVYFVAVLMYMSKNGDGIMSDRYSNYLCSADDSLFSAVKNVLADPAYVFTQIFLDKGGTYQDKLLFILQMLVPFAFIPLCVKKVQNLILLFPMLLINLMSLYVYQYDIGFQYVYGPLPFIIYLFIINASEGEEEKTTTALRVAAVAAILLLCTNYVPKTLEVMTRAIKESGDTKIVNEYLDSLPEDASICTSTFFIPRLSDHKILYEDFYHKPADGEKLDYIIVDSRYSKEQFIPEYEEYGYEVTLELKNEEGKLLLTEMQPKK